MTFHKRSIRLRGLRVGSVRITLRRVVSPHAGRDCGGLYVGAWTPYVRTAVPARISASPPTISIVSA